MTIKGNEGKVSIQPEWLVSAALVPYPEALAAMEARVEAIECGKAGEQVWLLSHPPLYTAGVSAREDEILGIPTLPVYHTGRGGSMTYHGPGQRVAYVMSDLRLRGRDVRAHVARLEAWIISVLARLGVTGEVREGRVGVWVVTPEGEKKIAAIGVRVHHWVTYHGLALNSDPDLTAYQGIVPCGIRDYGVTSLRDLGVEADAEQVDALFQAEWRPIFGAEGL